MLEHNASIVMSAARYSEPHDAFFSESLVYAVDVRCAVALKRIEKSRGLCGRGGSTEAQWYTKEGCAEIRA